MDMKTKPSPLYSLQYLRAVAALLVVWYHTDHLGLKYTWIVPNFGERGVDLFFVISGFIIVVSTERKISTAEFFRKRIARIVPLYWLVTISYLVLAVVEPSLLRSGNGDLSSFFKSLFFIPHYNPVFPDKIWPLVIPGWSLNYEMFFYFVFGIIFLFTKTWRAVGTSLAILGLAAIGYTNPVASSPIVVTYTDPLLIEFSFGIVGGALFLSSFGQIQKFLFIFIFIAMVLVIFRSGPIAQSLRFAGVCVCLVYTGAEIERCGYIKQLRLLALIGDASYSIYLTHSGVISLTRMFFDRVGLNEIPYEMGLALTIALSISFGLITYMCIERHLNRALYAALGSKRLLLSRGQQSPTA
jgi:exopolysaccharide production protein ExoZ